MNVHRLLGMVSGATNFIATSSYDILSTVIFTEFTYSWNRSYKIDKTSMLSSNLNSICSSTRVLDLKILPQPRIYLNKL